jgi:predicted extracellular nuclease
MKILDSYALLRSSPRQKGRVKLMKVKLMTSVVSMVLSVLWIVGVTPASAATGDPVLINEVLASHSGTDDTEYVELYGTPGTSLLGLSIIVVEGDASVAGTIDRRFDFKAFHEIGANGFFLLGNCAGVPSNYGETPDASISTNDLENSSLTVALVETSSISGGSVTGSEVVRDAVALTDGGAGDTFFFGAPVIGPDGPFFPAGARRVTDGIDTDTAADWVIASFSLPGANTPTGGGFDGCAPIPLSIPEIQGDSRRSDFEGEVVITSGVVTLYSSNGRDFWLQDPDGDGDTATSDGIVVDDGGFLPGPPEVGDWIEITAVVEEQQFGNALPLTRLDAPSGVTILSSGNPLPAPVQLGDLPDESMPDGELFWEPLEGMLVSVENAPVVAPTNQFGEFGMLTKDDAKPGSGFFPQKQQILVRELSHEPNVIDYNPERIMVDDTSLDAPIVVMPGDRVRSLVGVVDYTFSMYKLQPASYDVFTHDLPNLPASTRSGPNGDTVITTFNVENLFDLELNTPDNVDVFGQVGFDPGSAWGPPATQNNTLVRKPEVCQGDNDPSDTFDPALQWIGLGNNVFSGLGTHTVICGNTSGLIISEYIEGSSLNKALEIYNGTGSAVNLGASNVTVQIFFNGSTSAGQTISLSGTLADGDVFVLANPGADPAILAVTDQTSGGVLFNGDDAITLNIGGKDDAGSTPTPEELETQLAKLALAIEVELGLPEILVVQEVENTGILQVLGDRVNAATGTGYVATSFETSDGRGIEVGFLWDADRVALLNAFQMSGPGVEQWFGPSSPSPGREPLVGVFDIEGQTVTIIGNHFKSKGGDDPLYGINWPPFRVTEIQRKGQARVVRDFVNGILDSDPDARVMVTGDLNDFQFGEPGEDGIGSEPGHPVSIVEGSGTEVPLINLLNLEKPAEAYTFVFDGNSQVLDHMLVSPALLSHVVGADILHFNAGFPGVLGEDASTPLRASDHDPVEGRFRLR